MKTLWIVGLAALLTVPFAVADEREEEQERRELEEIMEGLEHGMQALKALGAEREFKAVQRIANGVRERLEHRERRREREDPERAMAERQLHALRIAFENYQDHEGKKFKRLAGMTEHAIHARELRLEGRRDKEAVRVYESAPNEGNTIELLLYAYKLLDKRGQKDRAEIVGRAVREMQEHWEKRRDRQKEHEGGLEQRVARLERSVARLAEILERLVDEMEDDDDDEDDDEDEDEDR